jgi:hypothetical protein
MRAVISVVLVGLAIVLAGCAHQQSVAERARLVCEERGVPGGPELAACIEETEEVIRRAREYERPPPPRPPSSQR